MEENEDDMRKKTLKFDKSLPYILQKDQNGTPVLPTANNLTLPKLKEVMRTYITMKYSK